MCRLRHPAMNPNRRVSVLCPRARCQGQLRTADTGRKVFRSFSRPYRLANAPEFSIRREN
jgi:hypothetical protein